jgi:hypothetical protein
MQPHPWVHRAWRIATVLTICAGVFHLLNLVDAGRLDAGPLLLTPFRALFILAWLLLLADYGLNRRRPRLDGADVLVAAAAAVFLLRAVFTADTFAISVNWLLTGAGLFFLVKQGMRDRADVCLVLWTVAAAVLALCIFGLFEYLAKANPLFDSIQVEAIGSDIRIGASDQFYRVRSLVGHPAFAAAIPLSAAPVIAMLLWRRKVALVLSLTLVATVVFLTFSRGTWLLALVLLLPLTLYLARTWLRRNLKWVALAAAALVALAGFLMLGYWQRQMVTADLSSGSAGEGLSLEKVEDGSYHRVDGEGVEPDNSSLYFDMEDDFYQEGDGAVTIVVDFLDEGLGRVRVEYWSRAQGGEKATYRSSAGIDKTGTGHWTSAAFYIEDADFSNAVAGADFRLVDEDGRAVFRTVSLRKGKLSLPEVVAQQWRSRRGSIATRLDFFPFTWEQLRLNPWGAGLFNTPGTDHHAIDSLPLTWVIEFGWPGLLLLAGLAWLMLREGMMAWRHRRRVAAMLYLSLLILLLHGAFLMILYDKPSLVLAAVLGAVYASVRPRGGAGPTIELEERGCMA